MNARRPPSAPPEIPGFGYLQLLGSGGFADVFLYEQRMPRRRVAIKVLLSETLTEGARESFDAEANLMAQLSTHPSIVTIYQAGIAEDGRPYLAMEYCPKPNLGARYRREKISVAEALRIGIQVAGAVETSHRAGILHRDIKPANILVTEYNRPALTDFGISVTLVGGDEQESVGMSIPWSPPEVFGAAGSSGVAADIYSLGATVYTILAGRSPFEVPNGANSGLDLIARIQSSPLTKTGRADVPASLEDVLATAMAKQETARYSSALEFARALQKVQLELSMSVTPADVLDEQVAAEEIDEEDDGNTRIRGMVSIDPTAPVTGRRRPGGAAAPPVAPYRPATPLPVAGPAAGASGPPVEQTVVRGTTPPPGSAGVGAGAGAAAHRSIDAHRFAIDEPPVEQTVHRAPTASGDDGTTAGAPRSRRLPLILGAAALVLIVGIGGLVFALNSGSTLADQDVVASDKPVDQIDVGNSVVPGPTAVTGAPGADGVVFTWTNPDPEDGDSYRWSLVTPGQINQAVKANAATVTVPYPEGGAPGTSVCIEVALVRSDGRGSEPVMGCTP
ncbi:MAG: serine/threonine protein kinase [Herbiconiux sp.]|uniref:protein kinase domain-containing protein n=1 Tax=Herbiconiux sp. TaxID=1871186 RepID=UPI0011FC3FCC|nr:protein kinase [Herbiconiux sp.]TAJ48217.1 MAG: serine/threonine protein kinase [Herbiconiux sp.]